MAGSDAGRPAGPEGAAPGQALRRTLDSVCGGLGLIGGIALLGAMLVIVASVTGGLVKAPILGDTEIVDLLIAVAVFCYLPYCHLHGGNVVVDFFARPLPQAARDWLDAVMNVAFAAVAVFLTWRLAAGGISAHVRDQRGMFLQLPEWPIYAVGVAACLLWIAVIAFTTYESALRARGKLPPLEARPTSAV